MTAHSSANDIINTFNHFFSNVPTNKSFDMTYKVYIRDFGDFDDRSILSARSSMVNVQGVKPVTIASQGVLPTASSTGLDLSLISVPGTKASYTSLASVKTCDTVSMTQIDRLCAESMARKERSMVNLEVLSKKFGSECPLQPPPPPFAASPSIYENLGVLSSKPSSGTSTAPKMFNEKVREFDKVKAKKEESSGEEKVYVKIAHCFD